MAFRTPNASGLTVAPSNPEALGGHSYWGEYAAATQLPNAAANAAQDPAFSLLQAGDTAFVAGGTLYTCTNPGTLNGADATWLAL